MMKERGFDKDANITEAFFKLGNRSSPSASALCNSWDDVFAEGLPCLASERLRPGTLPALDRWRDHDYLVRHLPDVTVHEATPSTVQLMSEVQPLASELAELAWHRPWRERNISSRHLFRSGALDDASFGADGGGNIARQLSAVVSVAVEALPRRGDTLAPAAWQMLRASLLEDLACKVVKARRVEAVLRWIACGGKIGGVEHRGGRGGGGGGGGGEEGEGDEGESHRCDDVANHWYDDVAQADARAHDGANDYEAERLCETS
eukprot:jgi/Chrpa1/26324/Chrysochromulina_OHIO_Genome00008793-RA